MTFLSALKCMFSFYTMLPINVDQKDMDAMNGHFYISPIVGLFYGLLLVAVFVPLQHFVNPLVAAVTSLFVVEALNRFLHLDGTVDLGDGLTVSGTREDHVRALKDTRVGAGGVCTGIFVVLLMVCGYSTLGSAVFYLGFAVEILAKNTQVATACFGNPSDGMASESVRKTNFTGLLISSLLSAVLIAAVFFALRFVFPDTYAFRDEYVLVAIVGLVVSILWGFILARISNRNFGFVNGDVLGASNETFKAIILIVGSIILATVTI